MSTLDQCVDRVYVSLDRPDNLHLPASTVAVAILDVGDRLITELQMTQEAWLEGRVTIHAEANKAVYIINAPDFSKGRYLFTKDDTDPSHRRRKIKIVEQEELTEFFGGGEPDIGSSTAVKHNARAAAVYYDSDQRAYRLELGPIPNQTADYDFFFEPATERPQSKEDIAFRFPQFDGYVSDKAAMRVIRSCTWKDMAPADCLLKRNEIRGDLSAQITEGDNLFRRWKMSMTNQTSYMRPAFGRGRW